MLLLCSPLASPPTISDAMNVLYMKNYLVIIRKKRWIITFILLLVGSMIYLLYRPQTILLFRLIDSMGLTPYLNIIREKCSIFLFPPLVINSLPAGLWMASYLMIMYSTTKYQNRKYRLMFSLPLPISAILLEIMQLFGWCHGTFDIFDLVCYVIPLIIFLKSI